MCDLYFRADTSTGSEFGDLGGVYTVVVGFDRRKAFDKFYFGRAILDTIFSFVPRPSIVSERLTDDYVFIQDFLSDDTDDDIQIRDDREDMNNRGGNVREDVEPNEPYIEYMNCGSDGSLDLYRINSCHFIKGAELVSYLACTTEFWIGITGINEIISTVECVYSQHGYEEHFHIEGRRGRHADTGFKLHCVSDGIEDLRFPVKIDIVDIEGFVSVFGGTPLGFKELAYRPLHSEIPGFVDTRIAKLHGDDVWREVHGKDHTCPVPNEIWVLYNGELIGCGSRNSIALETVFRSPSIHQKHIAMRNESSRFAVDGLRLYTSKVFSPDSCKKAVSDRFLPHYDQYLDCFSCFNRDDAPHHLLFTSSLEGSSVIKPFQRDGYIRFWPMSTKHVVDWYEVKSFDMAFLKFTFS